MNVVSIMTHISALKGVVYLNFSINDLASQAPAKRDDLREMMAKRQSNDRIMPWMEKHLTETSYAAMAHCGDYLVFLEDAARENRKLDVGFFCRQRLCSGCAWRAAVKSAQCVAAIAAALTTEQDKVMLMVTLTVPNVPAKELRHAIQGLGQSWIRLLKRQRYQCWADCIRKVEITYNKRTDTYHPHLHCVVFVGKSYFGKRYISQQQLLEDWRQVTKKPEITQVDLRRCRDRGTTNAILEVAKYSAKASDYAQSETVLDTMYDALHHTRTMTYAGKCKELREAYLKSKLERFEEIDTVKYTVRVVYVWQRIMDSGAWQYVEHDAQPYSLDEAEAARLIRDEERAVAYAMEAGKRATGLDWLFKTSWARADWDNVEVWDDTKAELPTPLSGEQVEL